MRHFKAMLRKVDNNFLREFKLPPERVEAMRPVLDVALLQVEELLAAERRSDATVRQQVLLQQQPAKDQKVKDQTQTSERKRQRVGVDA